MQACLTGDPMLIFNVGLYHLPHHNGTCLFPGSAVSSMSSCAKLSACLSRSTLQSSQLGSVPMRLMRVDDVNGPSCPLVLWPPVRVGQRGLHKRPEGRRNLVRVFSSWLPPSAFALGWLPPLAKGHSSSQGDLFAECSGSGFQYLLPHLHLSDPCNSLLPCSVSCDFPIPCSKLHK